MPQRAQLPGAGEMAMSGPRRPWIIRMRWRELLFAHWPVPIDSVRAFIPHDLEIDTYDGEAWVGIVPFRMVDVAPRGLPAPPMAGAFNEVNVRTYVRRRGRPGVWFFSLDAGSRIAVEGARRFFHVPYLWAAMSMTRDRGAIEYRSVRRDRRAPPASLDLRYRPLGPVQPVEPGSLDAWLTDRWRAYSMDGAGRVIRTEIRHAPWPLQPAEAEIRVESLAAALGIDLPAMPPRLAYASRVDVRGWWPRPA
jgi:uncharacterized protein YqjF (DUF2071 family)